MSKLWRGRRLSAANNGEPVLRVAEAIAQLPRLGVEDRIQNDVAEIAGTNLVDLG